MSKMSREDISEHHGGAVDEGKNKSRISSLLDEVCPQLTLYRGREKLSRKKSALVVGLLYVSHSFSAWGDRMWGYVVSLFLVILYPGSLLLPAIFGFLVQLSTAFFGTLVGDWVDANPRMRVVWLSLLVQNSLVALCSVAIALMFELNWNVCQHVVIFACLTPLVIIFGSGANLATVANTISIEKDWVVVIADKNENTLAALNSNMRRIDLVCKLLSPAVTGIILQQTGAFVTTIFVAVWNVVSFFGELLLVWMVYRMIPTLAVKKLRKQSTIDMTSLIKKEENRDNDQIEDGDEGSSKGKVKGQSGENEEEVEEEDEVVAEDTLDLHPLPDTRQRCPCCQGKTGKICSHLLTPFTTIINGWRIYMKQEIALIGFAMASIYLTVLGFSGVTAAYFLTQGLRNDIIGVCQGIGAVFGVTGTVIFPFVRRRVGTVRTGLFGICTQWAILLLCIVAIAVPSNRIASQAEGYYSADCSEYLHPDTKSNLTNVTVSGSVSIMTTQQCIVSTHDDTTPLSMTATSLARSMSVAEEHSMTTSRWLPVTNNSVTYTTASSLDKNTRSMMTSSGVVPTKTSIPMLSATPIPSRFNFGELKKRFIRDVPASSTLPPCTPPMTTPTSSTHTQGSNVSIALIFMLLGVICCRIGLWTFDLAVQQLVQEKVKEEERGVVSGVMNAMNSIMDMLHYVLVIAAPRPEHFSILTVISVGMVTLGVVLYAAYVHKVRGHLFHVMDCCRWMRRKMAGRRRGRGRGRGSVLIFAEEDDQTSFINDDADDEIDNLLEDEDFGDRNQMKENVSEEKADRQV